MPNFKNIVLLLGFPRSGTTWLGNILDSCPDVLYKNEPFGPFHQKYHFLPCERRYIDISRYSVDEIKKNDLMKVLRIIGKNFSSSNIHFCKSFRNYSKIMSRIYKVISRYSFSELTDNFLKNLFCKNVNERSLTFVIKEVRYISVWFKILSNCANIKIVYLVRNPFAVYNSLKYGFHFRSKLNLNHKNRRIIDQESIYLNKLSTIPINISTISNDRFLLRIINWKLLNEFVIKNYSKNKNVKIVKYEDLAKNPLRIAKQIYSFLDLEWTPQTENFILDSSTNTQFSFHQKSRGEFYSNVMKDSKKVADKWKSELDKESIKKIKKIVGDSFLMNYWPELKKI